MGEVRVRVWYMGVRVRINENRVEWMNREKEIVWNKLLIKKEGGDMARLLCGLAIPEVQ